MTPWLRLLGSALFCATMAAPAAHARGRARLDLYKPWPQADKVYVEVDLGDGKPRVMLLDSGAGTTLITPKVARELGLPLSAEVRQYVQISGLLEARSAIIPELRIGGQRVFDVHAAVPEEAVAERAGGVETAGLLGANVLSRFQVWVDYPAQRLELRRPGHRPPPTSAVPMTFDGQHAMTAIRLWPASPGAPEPLDLLVDIDTGARGLWLFGALPDSLSALAGTGQEPVLGISAPENQPTEAFLRETRRVPIARIEAGGAQLSRPVDAIWTLPPEGQLPSASPGLLGHEVLDGHRVLLDYGAQRFALLPPRRERPERDIHEWKLRTLRDRRDPEQVRERATLLAWLDRLPAARKELSRHLRRVPGDHAAGVLLARILRVQGEPMAALDLLAELPIEELVESGELVGVVNSRALLGQGGEGLDLARKAVEARPDAPVAWIALADAQRATGLAGDCRRSLLEATTRLGEPEAQLMRRAWCAAEDGDLDAALSHLRRQLEREPSGTITPWFYARILVRSGEQELGREDLQRLLGRLHEGQGALDFLAHASLLLGDREQALALAERGRQRDCTREDGDARDNCEAWYRAIVEEDLPEALALAQRAVAAEPHRAAYLDTLANVLAAMGRLDEAREASKQAALLEPDDVYLLWQAALLASSDRG